MKKVKFIDFDGKIQEGNLIEDTRFFGGKKIEFTKEELLESFRIITLKVSQDRILQKTSLNNVDLVNVLKLLNLKYIPIGIILRAKNLNVILKGCEKICL